MTARRLLAAIVFALLAATGAGGWSLLFVDHGSESVRERLRGDLQMGPHYLEFLDGVRAHTAPGQTIVLIVPPMEWEHGYAFSYYYASYFLAGRTVLPMVDDAHHVLWQNFRKASLAAIWVRPFPLGHRKILWKGNGGVLVKTQ